MENIRQKRKLNEKNCKKKSQCRKKQGGPFGQGLFSNSTKTVK